MTMISLDDYKKVIKEKNFLREIGKVIQIIGLIIEADGPSGSIGDLCYIYLENGNKTPCEIVGFKEGRIQLMPLASMEGLKPDLKVINTGSSMKIRVGEELVGRVLDGLGNPIDDLGEINTQNLYSTNSSVINPLKRKIIDDPLALGIRSVDGFMTVGKGQRMGIFAGSGVGKSTTLA